MNLIGTAFIEIEKFPRQIARLSMRKGRSFASVLFSLLFSRCVLHFNCLVYLSFPVRRVPIISAAIIDISGCRCAARGDTSSLFEPEALSYLPCKAAKRYMRRNSGLVSLHQQK